MSENKKETILLIEDDDDHAEIIEFYIQENSSDYDIVRLADGKLALDYIKELQTDPWLILLDLKVPKFDGHEILKYIKSNDTIKHLPVVVFTTSNSDKDITSALELGANSYLVKPTDPDEFLQNIALLLAYWKINKRSHITEETSR